VPVICIGNINAGGTGKTPTTIALAQRLRDRGLSVHVVTRGHGGSLEGPVEVEELRHRASDTGDEALASRRLRDDLGGQGQACGRARGGGRRGPM
jgi:tetraacyldisaccharide 4'-kinase